MNPEFRKCRRKWYWYFRRERRLIPPLAWRAALALAVEDYSRKLLGEEYEQPSMLYVAWVEHCAEHWLNRRNSRNRGVRDNPK